MKNKKDYLVGYKTEKDFLLDIRRHYSGIKMCIRALGYPTDTDNFKDTPKRCAKAFLEFIYPKDKIEKEIKKLLARTFKATCDEMVVVTNIRVISLCPHHLLPVEMMVNIGYIPKDKVLGLSKLIRLPRILGKQPILQEEYTRQVVDCIERELKPSGVGVYIKGKHGCMRFRGANAPESDTITSHLSGNFRNQQSTRDEFIALCRNNS